MEQSERKLSPPYMSWKTFTGFIRSFDQGLPPRIDKSAMNRLNGQNQNMMTNALIYLKLTKPDGKPEHILEQIVDSFFLEKPDDYKAHLTVMLKNSYPFLFDKADDFDLEKSTSASFDEKFRGEGVGGDTVLKCEAFFIAAAQEAGIKISRLIMDAKKKGPKRVSAGGSVKSKNNKPEFKQHEETSPPPAENPKPPVQELSAWYLTFKPAFDKLPSFDKAHWTSVERDKWIVLITALVDVYVDLDDGKKK